MAALVHGCPHHVLSHPESPANAVEAWSAFAENAARKSSRCGGWRASLGVRRPPRASMRAQDSALTTDPRRAKDMRRTEDAIATAHDAAAAHEIAAAGGGRGTAATVRVPRHRAVVDSPCGQRSRVAQLSRFSIARCLVRRPAHRRRRQHLRRVADKMWRPCVPTGRHGPAGRQIQLSLGLISSTPCCAIILLEARRNACGGASVSIDRGRPSLTTESDQL